jgi:hypothetical protein
VKSPYGDARLCAELSTEELENTFHYPGSQTVGHKPGPVPAKHWDMAKEICIECPVFLACRETSWGEEFGVWGGTDQYERYLYRRRQQRLLARQDEDQRAALAATIHAERGSVEGWRLSVIVRRTGLSANNIKILVAEHQAVLDAEKQRRALETETAREAVGWTSAEGAEGKADGPKGRHPWKGKIAA